MTPVGGVYDAMRERKRDVIARCDLADHAFANKGIIGRSALGKGPFEEILDRARSAVFEAADLIEQLEVAPSPREPATCTHCRYLDCCRPEDANVFFDREPGGGGADE